MAADAKRAPLASVRLTDAEQRALRYALAIAIARQRVIIKRAAANPPPTIELCRANIWQWRWAAASSSSSGQLSAVQEVEEACEFLLYAATVPLSIDDACASGGAPANEGPPLLPDVLLERAMTVVEDAGGASAALAATAMCHELCADVLIASATHGAMVVRGYTTF